MVNKRFTEISQVGIVARDKEKVIANMREVFGAEPDQCTVCKVSPAENNGNYYGEPGDFEADLLFYNFANLQIEYMIPRHGKNIWSDWMDEHGEGIHHVLFNVDSFDGAVADMKEKGIDLIQDGPSTLKKGLHWGYFDGYDKVGFVFEVKNTKEKLD
ncbi:MAG: VOC family protein [Oscillibacter sp.]|nr:VOC family protein [Oscillibacter sp.]